MRLLVVEDEARLARALQRGLTADGFTVDVVGDGVSGLARAREGQYDAVLLDVMLPALSGYEVVKRLRAEDNWVPVMMVSAKDGPYDQADGLDYGADDYLTKPFDYVVLLARLRALLRRQSDPRPPVLTHGDVALDPATREVTLGRAAGRAELDASTSSSSSSCVTPTGWSPRPSSSTGSGTPAVAVTSPTPSRCTSDTCVASSALG